ncbi:acyltransferase [Arthrobacter sp. Br18]|uniref:acyltransferase family protein n=1 Tax=Arthrobacter sp. Br18 TaxID=1312954 RepID=UPI00138AFF9B|nr:acyltransferase [Arthrobacter sp. Br18]
MVPLPLETGLGGPFPAQKHLGCTARGTARRRGSAIEAAKGTRVDWLDSLRGVAILLVVVLHAGEALRFLDEGLPPVIETFNQLLEPFRIPVLMFLSGVLLPRSLGKPRATYFAGKAARVGWPYLLWSVIILAASANFTLADLAEIAYFPPTYLWYLWFLLVFYAVAFPLRRIPPLYPALAGFLVSLALPEAGMAGMLAFLFGFFFLGAWTAQHWETALRITRNWWVISLSAAAAAGVAFLSAQEVEVLYRTQFAWGVVGVLVIAARLFPRMSGGDAGRGLAFVGRNSIVFYVTHLAPIMITVALADAVGLSAPWLLYPLLVILGIGIPLGVACIYSRGDHASVTLLFEFPRVHRVPRLRRGTRRARA